MCIKIEIGCVQSPWAKVCGILSHRLKSHAIIFSGLGLNCDNMVND